jgi:hypothetical protein
MPDNEDTFDDEVHESPETRVHPDEGIDHDPEDAVAEQGYRPDPRIWNRLQQTLSFDIVEKIFGDRHDGSGAGSDHLNPAHISMQEGDITNVNTAKIETAEISEANADAANIDESNVAESNVEKANIDEAEIDEANIEQANAGLVNTESASVGSGVSSSDALTLEHPETDADYDFGPEGQFRTDSLETGGGDSDLHYTRIFRDIFSDETVSADISLSADRGQLIKINSFRADISSSLYLRFDDVADANYYYKAVDARTHEPIIEDETNEIALINNVYDSEEYPSGAAWRGEVVNTRSSRPGLIGSGTSRRFEEGEEFLEGASLNRSVYPSEINIYTNDRIEEVEIEVYEPVPDADRPTGDWG